VTDLTGSEGRPGAGLGDVVTVLAPAAAGEAFADFLEATRSVTGEPFAPARVAAVEALSTAFLAHPLLRQDAASSAVAFWMRRAQVARLEAEWERRVQADPGVIRVPVGRVLHLAPANVDTLFLYSWALSFLCGNANVVRLSQERDPLVEAMLQAIRDLAASHRELRESNRFVTYAHDAGATTVLSAWCSHRVIWGGNDTVAAVRPLSLNPHASERVFGSKFSYSVIAAAGYLAAGTDARARIAQGFFNDLFWFDQMACSSPHLLFWVGDEPAVVAAIEAFERDLQGEADRRGFVPSASTAVHRRAFAFGLAMDADVEVSLVHRGFVGVRVRDPRGLAREICGGGLLRHYRLDRLEDLYGFAEEGDQTVTHFGFERDQLVALAAQLGVRGVDRVVPVGEALAFEIVWDGFDLLDDFTRRVRVR
jgi:hypothetical protein